MKFIQVSMLLLSILAGVVMIAAASGFLFGLFVKFSKLAFYLVGV